MVEPRRRGFPWAPVTAAAVLAGAFDTAHDLGRRGSVDVACLAFATVGIFGELAALSAIFAAALQRRTSSVRAFALTSAAALGLGIGTAYVGWAIQGMLGVDLLGLGNAVAGRAASMGAVDGLLGLGLWAIAVVLPFAVRDANARALESDRLRTAAELARLRSHLQPHFVLNTLNTVAGLVVQDPHAARDLLGTLGDLLRDSLEEADEMQTLGDEIQWLRRYAHILETRHRGALRFEWSISDETRGVRVPRLLLQPLLENAVQHGALRRAGGEVHVRTRRGDDGRVQCVVEDNGPGPGARAARPGALGIQLVTRRLELQYADGASFRLESFEGLTRSIVELPAGSAS